MLLPHESELFETVRQAKLGRAHLPPVLECVRNWLAGHYSVQVLHLDYRSGEVPPPSLRVVVDSDEDCAKLTRDGFSPKRHIVQAIRRHLTRSAEDAGLAGEYLTDRMRVRVDSFAWAAKDRAISRFHDEHRLTVAEEVAPSNVWTIAAEGARIVVFYETDEEVRIRAADGTSDAIKWRCFDLVKRYDEFGYFTWCNFPFAFDSKERLDAEFEGSLFYYFR